MVGMMVAWRRSIGAGYDGYIHWLKPWKIGRHGDGIGAKIRKNNTYLRACTSEYTGSINVYETERMEKEPRDKIQDLQLLEEGTS